MFACVATGFLLPACVPLISGDLEDTRTMEYRSCDEATTPYRVVFTTNADNGVYSENPAIWITLLTFGIVPTYWSEAVWSQAELYRGQQLLERARYESRIRVFYGLLWLLTLDANSVNGLEANSTGREVRTGTRNRTIAKLINGNASGISPSQVCYVSQ